MRAYRTQRRNWWPEVYQDACLHWGLEPDSAVLAYHETYESKRADRKEISVVISDVANPHFAQLVHAIEDIAYLKRRENKMQSSMAQGEISAPVKDIHLVFKTHLDLGFTDFARQVIDNYFTSFIPRALSLAESLRQEGRPERFIWTTGAFLIYEYLEQASSQERARMEQAIGAGDIAWHGMPFTVHSELMEPSLFRYGLSLSQQLDRRFGKTTIAAKMTDVAGHTRGIVPLLVEAGIRFLHIGVNPAVIPPDVPPVFAWRAPGGEELVVMYHHAYGGVATIPGTTEALCIEMTGDNLGPQSSDAVVETFQRLRTQFPEARVQASTLDAFAQRVLEVQSSLPVITDEIGDTWIHGVGSDPRKVSHYRELCRLRNDWLASEQEQFSEPVASAFSQALLQVPEHTWGMDEKTHLADEVNYSVAQLVEARTLPHFQKFEASWQEQQEYLATALGALEETSLAQQARAQLAALDPVWPETKGWTVVKDVSALFETTHFRLGFAATQGGVVSLEQKATGRQWASPDHPLGVFRYETFSAQHYERFLQQYVKESERTTWWVVQDLTKPGMDTDPALSATWEATLSALYQKEDAVGCHFLAALHFPDTAREDGRPRQLFLQVSCPHAEAVLHFDAQWFQKPAYRLPEALWLSFAPQVSEVGGWSMEKLGQWLSPLEVVRNGNRKLHALGRGIAYRDAHRQLLLETLDAPLVAPGERSLLNFNNTQPPLEQGWHFNLLNNLYGTNFRMWYDEDARFRFLLHLSEMAGSRGSHWFS